MINFDEIIKRKNTESIKYDGMKPLFGSDDLLPLWVADMDFRTADFITDAIKKRIEHGVFGYTLKNKEYYQTIQEWLKRKHGWTVETEWLRFIPGIVTGLAYAIDCFTSPGDGVLIQTPVYPPFMFVPKKMGRKVVENRLINTGTRYEMDFEDLDKNLEQVKMMVLCSPHNPGGAIWSKEDLRQVASLCAKHGVLLVSDEIHAEMAYDGYKHYPLPMAIEGIDCKSITFMSPSKTFNIAGLISSYAIVPDQELRKQFYQWVEARHLDNGSLLSYTATKAAYKEGDAWLKEMLHYVQGNVAYVTQYLEQNIPQIKSHVPEASFLMWLDCRGLKMSHEELKDLFYKKAKLALNDGESFGSGGTGFFRLNVGCPRAVLAEAMKKLNETLSKK